MTCTTEADCDGYGGSCRDGLCRQIRNPSAALDHWDILAEYSVSSSDPNKANPQERRRILRVPQPFANHNVLLSLLHNITS